MLHRNRLLIASIAAAAALIPAASSFAQGTAGPGPFGRPGAPTRPPADPSKYALIAGQVVDGDTDQPIAGASVSLSGPSFGVTIVADSKGRFAVAPLVPGRYRATAQQAGYFNMAVVHEIVTGDAARITDVKVRLYRMATLSGTVRDETGDPVAGMMVTATRPGSAGSETSGPVRTDDRGNYQLSVRPGDYLICACAQDPLPLDGTVLTALAAEPVHLLTLASRAMRLGADVAVIDRGMRTFAPTFYPSSQIPARATTVTIGAGETRGGVDIEAQAVHAARVSGAIVGASRPVSAQNIRLVPQYEGKRASLYQAMPPTLVQPDGRFDFVGVPPGSYLLRVVVTTAASPAGAPSGTAMIFAGGRPPSLSVGIPVAYADLPVIVGDNDVMGLVVTMKTATSVSGTIEGYVAPPAKPGERVRGLAVYLSEVDRDVTRPILAGQSAATDRTFSQSAIVPGRYLVRFSGPPNVYMKKVTLHGMDVTDLPVDIGEEGANDFVVTVASGVAATVSGTLTGPPTASIVLFPTDQRYWATPEASTRIQAVSVDSSGAFSTKAPAGEYFIAPLDDNRYFFDWPRLNFQELSSKAQRLIVPESGTVTIAVKR